MSFKNNIYHYLNGARQIGHTKLLVESLKNAKEPFFILGADMRHAKELERQINNPLAIPVSLKSSEQNMRGRRLPLVMDNYALTAVIEECEGEMSALRVKNLIEIGKVNKTNRALVKELEKFKGLYWAQERENRYAKIEVERQKELANKHKEKASYYEGLAAETEVKNKKDFLDSMNLFQRIFKRIK
jgi:hypothetical protein